LPLAPGRYWQATVLGQERDFCCPGCQAVARLIVTSGNESYYELRHQQLRQNGSQPDFAFEWNRATQPLPAEAPGTSGNSFAAAASAPVDFSLYDDPAFQAGFVRHLDNGQSEALLLLEGIRCAACVWLNENYLRQLPGVESVTVDYSSGQMRVRWRDELIPLSRILEAVSSLGYQAHPFDSARRESLNREAGRKNLARLVFALILSMEVMAHAIATYTVGGPDASGQLPLWERIGRWTDLLVVTALLVYVGGDFYRSAWRDLKNRYLGMDVPIVIGLSVAYLTSVVATWHGDGHVYFDSIAMFLTLMMAARYFELKARLKAAVSFDRLLKMTPRSARRVVAKDKQPEAVAEETVPVARLRPGDCIRVLAGESVPVDGRLQSDSGVFNEAHVTGEPVPVRKKAGDRITAGSLAVEQPARIKVTQTVERSTLAQLVTLAARSAAGKPPLAQAADRIARWFVPAVLLLAAVTFYGWSQWQPELAVPVAIAVLIVTCPCALGLATPVVLSLAAGVFSRQGIVPLDNAGLEAIPRANVWAFDKTGTVTQGCPRVVAVWPLDANRNPDSTTGRPPDFALLEESTPTNTQTAHWLAVACALEAQSSHPLAQAFKAVVMTGLSEASSQQEESLASASVVNSQQSIIMQNLKTVPGQGVEGDWQGDHWQLGSLSWCGLSALEKSFKPAAGETLVALCRNRQACALFKIADPLRPGTRRVMQQLRAAGIRTVLISGDAPGSVAAVAKALQMDEWQAQARPDAKLAWLQQQQQVGHRLVFVGDGVNDAPVLAAANTSVSFASATELAQMNSQFVLMRSDFQGVLALRAISTRAVRLMQQNFAWALGYNALAIPLAAAGLVPPWLAALGMSISSFVVIGNSLRLRRGMVK
jgi:Cu2+-exporting ATPase